LAQFLCYNSIDKTQGGKALTKKQLKYFINPETLDSERLTLRKISKEDISDINDYAKNPNVSKYLLWSPHESIEHTKNYYYTVEHLYSKGKFYDYAVVLKENSKMIGTCGFTSFDLKGNRGEIGYVLNEKFWGFGYAREAVTRLLKFAKYDLKLHSVFAKFIAENAKSEKLLSDLGFLENEESRFIMQVKGESKIIRVFEKIL
jgi:ribosomal-protein-alanine N-acetyltransferase